MRTDTAPKVVILDRDGTLNEFRADYVMSADDWVPLPGALEAVARLNQAGWHTVMATNQAGLGRGLYDMAAFNAVHLKLNHMLSKLGGRIDAVFFCPHTDVDGCNCRKPLPGLYQDIGKRYNLNLAEVPAVGESIRDVQAMAAAGCEPHLVLTGECRRLGPAHVAHIRSLVPRTEVHADLAEFAEFLIRREREVRGIEGSDSGPGALN
ncbi:MAG: D-glycero-beta-D-manno-heptose 1,7-bisphosphate 7-phosphatase [Pseudomonadota bacterium]